MALAAAPQEPETRASRHGCTIDRVSQGGESGLLLPPGMVHRFADTEWRERHPVTTSSGLSHSWLPDGEHESLGRHATVLRDRLPRGEIDWEMLILVVTAILIVFGIMMWFFKW